MSKNVLIFSDGTGQVGGVNFDEARTNIYKMYRATRVAPDSCINPSEQVAFYDPGIGSQTAGGPLSNRFFRWIYNLVSQATGFGLTANMIDCYAALIRLWEPGDKIYLFGFSRGAYTVRCLAAVIANCGIPTHELNGDRLHLDVKGSKELAGYAVKHVYQFTTSRPKRISTPRQQFLLNCRSKIAERFRIDHGSSGSPGGTPANVYPYFIGVFDTVAALWSLRKSAGYAAAYLVVAAVLSYLISAAFNIVVWRYRGGDFTASLPFIWVFTGILLASIAAAIAIFLYTHVKWDFKIPGQTFWQRLATIHFTSIWQTFDDYTLDDHVAHAKHAISIDENRKDFRRVGWAPPESNIAHDDPCWFEQVWFPGNHADLGGGYPENESRLSDAALKWMLASAVQIPHGIRWDRSVLNLHPDSAGMQHDEVKAGLGLITTLTGLSWPEGHRSLPTKPDPSDAVMHRSVYERFDLPAVLNYDLKEKYRPLTLRRHIDFKDAYDGGERNPTPECMARYVEAGLDQSQH